MRTMHVCVAVAALIIFLFFPISNSRVFINAGSIAAVHSAQPLTVDSLKLSGFDFITGNLPEELDKFSFPRSLTSHRTGAIFCLAALVGIIIAALFANRIFNPAPGNLFLIAIYFSGFIFIEDFKNAYFNYASELLSSKYSAITIESQITIYGIVINGVLLSTALFNVIFMFNRKLKAKHSETVR